VAEKKADKEFWLKTKQHVVQWGMVVGMAWVGIAIWTAFLQGPK
jgi:hypothetical protein